MEAGMKELRVPTVVEPNELILFYIKDKVNEIVAWINADEENKKKIAKKLKKRLKK
jgi:hypothetical protein